MDFVYSSIKELGFVIVVIVVIAVVAAVVAVMVVVAVVVLVVEDVAVPVQLGARLSL